MVTRNKGRIPRNKKKSWKKQVDVSHVEQYLDDVRLQERFGGLVECKQNASLFTIDTQPASADLCQSSAAPRHRAAFNTDDLACFQSLKGLPGANIPHNTRFIKDKQPQFVRDKKSLKDAKKELAALKTRQLSGSRGTNVSGISGDLWADADEQTPAQEDTAAWRRPGVRNRARCRMMRSTRRPLHLRIKSSLVPAVCLPDPGESYHPSTEDHDRLVQRATDEELRRLAEQNKWHRQTTAKFPRKLVSQEEYIREMSEGLPAGAVSVSVSDTVPAQSQTQSLTTASVAAQTEQQQDNETEVECSGPLVPVASTRPAKTLKQRRLMLQQRRATRARQQHKLLRQQQAQIYRFRAINRELSAAEAALSRRAAARAVSRHVRRTMRPLKLARLSCQPPPAVVQLTAELPGCLRAASAEQHPLAERFWSLQQRNIIEPRQAVKRARKYKLKVFARATVADYQLKHAAASKSTKKT